MSEIIITIDGVECPAQSGQYIVDAARENGVYIPTLCNEQGIHPKGACRICTVKVNGRFMTACSTPCVDGMDIENKVEDIQDIRKSIIEVLFVEGNHFCPACEKSGNCKLQALGYRYQMMVPRFPYCFPQKDVDGSNPKIIKEQNRCILCQRCMRTIKDEQGRSLFAYSNRGHKIKVVLDPVLGNNISDELAQKAMDICPVGSIIKKEIGFSVPIGKRTYDFKPIGHEIEQK